MSSQCGALVLGETFAASPPASTFHRLFTISPLLSFFLFMAVRSVVLCSRTVEGNWKEFGSGARGDGRVGMETWMVAFMGPWMDRACDPDGACRVVDYQARTVEGNPISGKTLRANNISFTSVISLDCRAVLLASDTERKSEENWKEGKKRVRSSTSEGRQTSYVSLA